MKKYKAIIFDFDGTLYSNDHLPVRLVFGDLRHLHLLGAERIERRKLKGIEFSSREELLSTLFNNIATRCHTTPAKAAHWYHEGYMPQTVDLLRRKYRIFGWVESVLAQCREKGLRLAVFSDYGYLREKLEALHLSADRFDVVADAPSLAGYKPCRRSFLLIAEQLQVAPEDILVIGDRDDTDGVGARAAGMDFVNIKRKEEFIPVMEAFDIKIDL